MLNKTAHPFLNANAHDRIGAGEITHAFAALKPLIQRMKAIITLDEARAFLLVLRLAQEAANVRAQALTGVTGVMRDYMGPDGVFSPPLPEIAQRLALSPEAVDAALGTLIADGHLVELRPKGFIRRQRRFRLTRPGTPPPS